MFRDLFDRLHLAAIAVVLVGLVLLLGGFVGSDNGPVRHKQDLSLERAMQERARASFLLEAYAPVEQMVAAGRYAEALLKLQGFEKEYPGEAHTLILRGAILVAQGVLGEGIDQYAMAVKLNGDYVDEKSSLNRRNELSTLVETSIPRIKKALNAGGNVSLSQSLKNVYYLQSRLAGGCE